MGQDGIRIDVVRDGLMVSLERAMRQETLSVRTR